MVNVEWPAEDYAIGSYIQAIIADQYLEKLPIKPADHILDVGCGDGSYTTKILKKIPEGKLVGIDRSLNMLQLARQKTATYPQFSVRQMDVLTMDYHDLFDYVVSFWCLQWCDDLARAYQKIYQALKPGGKLFTIIPSGDNDPFLDSIKAVISEGNFPELQQFKPPVDFMKHRELPNFIARLPFKTAEVEIKKHAIRLPSLDIFRKFVNGLAYFQGQIPDALIAKLNEAIVHAYDLDCQRKHHGEYWFYISVYLVVANK